MSEQGNFYNPEDVKPFYGEIAPTYQRAFAGDPWYEVSKCVDENDIQRCIGSFSNLSIGEMCDVCNNCPIVEAYEQKELIDKFEFIASTRPTAWYTERNEEGMTLAAIAWKETAQTIARERYADVPEMEPWMNEVLGTEEIIWLDEVFADKAKQPTGNLKNFASMCEGFREKLGSETIAFRTINPRMSGAAPRDFGKSAAVFPREVAVPDRREFVVIKLGARE